MKPWHIIVVVLVIIVVFGSAKLPEFARSLGQSARILRKEVRDMQEEDAATGAPQCCSNSGVHHVSHNCGHNQQQEAPSNSCQCAHKHSDSDNTTQPR